MTQAAPSIDRDSIVVRADDLPTSRIDNDAVILNIATGRYIGLDEIGRRIWEAIEMPVRVDDLCAQMADDYGESRTVVEQDVTAFLNEMLEESLVRVQA